MDFKNSRTVRDYIENRQRQEVTKAYQGALKDVQQKLEELQGKTGVTAELKLYEYQQLEKELKDIYRKVSEGTESSVKTAMLNTSTAVFNDYKTIIFGPYNVDTSQFFRKVPEQIVNNIVNGNLYRKPDVLGNAQKHWSLSKSIWGDNRRTQQDIHTIIARGVAQGKPVYEIAKDIEQYVTPQAMRIWDWSKVYPGTKKYIDYNAQRLVRTSVQHAFQQSVYETSDNPWSERIQWHSALIEGRTCPVCIDLDGKLFACKGDNSGRYPDLPDDHPNGLCWWSEDVDLVNVGRRLNGWINAPYGTYPEIDKYIERIRGQ